MATTSSILAGIITPTLLSLPIQAAEKLYFSYGPVMLSLKVDSLTEFAKTGTINKDLEFYLSLASPEQKQAFREALNKNFAISPVMASRFFNSKMGQSILTRLGKGITLAGGSNGGYALRSAIIQASFEPGGLSLLKIIQKLPTNMQLQGELLQGLAQKIEDLILATETLVTEMRIFTAQEAASNPPLNFADLPDLRQPGNYTVKKEVWQLFDSSRNRHLYADVFVPQKNREGKIPVLVFSHGLASRPEDYDVGLNHLASYGYFVIAPQHPGSDSIYLKEMFAGYHRDIFDVQEFIDRPKDISFVLDELERRNTSQFNNRLELTKVGMAGHSFGGYTTLAIAGADIDFDNLQRDCNQNFGALDISLLLECRALELPRQDYSFREPRVQAAFAANPVNRSIFGKQGLGKIQIPVLLASGSDDPAAPPVLEQTTSFLWLTTPDKYWILLEGQAHVNFTKLDAGISETLNSTLHFTLPSQNTIYNYVKGTSVAFFEVYVRQNDQSSEQFRPYLNPAYAQYLSGQQEFKLDLITDKSSSQLLELVNKFRAEHGELLTN